ncbi:FAD binding domain-containing protein [Flavobacterium paronense]|nr:FAD binding domain-containing protein [Flavobacterium paronense]MDN3675954.1 FAD binding domain-containing protein [Flavobacterium paronense]
MNNFFRPDSVEQALELKRRYQDEAVLVRRGSKLNATPTVPIKRLPFPYRIWNWTGLTGITVHCGLAQCLACSHCVMRDLFLQRCVEALGFVYSRHVRNQSTIGGEIAARQEESVLLPVLLALDAELVFGNGETLSIEDYLACPCDRLLTEIIIKESVSHLCDPQN